MNRCAKADIVKAPAIGNSWHMTSSTGSEYLINIADDMQARQGSNGNDGQLPGLAILGDTSILPRAVVMVIIQNAGNAHSENGSPTIKYSLDTANQAGL